MPFGISFFFWHSPCNQLVKMIPFQHVAARRRWRRKTTTHRFLPPHCKSMSSQPILVPLEPHERLRPLVIINDGVEFWVGIIALRGFFFFTILASALELGQPINMCTLAMLVGFSFLSIIGVRARVKACRMGQETASLFCRLRQHTHTHVHLNLPHRLGAKKREKKTFFAFNPLRQDNSSFDLSYPLECTLRMFSL